MRTRIADWKLVDENPLLDRRNFGHDSHAWTRKVLVVTDIVHYRSPVDEIFRSLMGEFLSVQGVSLVRVVDNQFVVVCEEERLPDRGCAVGRVWATTFSN